MEAKVKDMLKCYIFLILTVFVWRDVFKAIYAYSLIIWTCFATHMCIKWFIELVFIETPLFYIMVCHRAFWIKFQFLCVKKVFLERNAEEIKVIELHFITSITNINSNIVHDYFENYTAFTLKDKEIYNTKQKIYCCLLYINWSVIKLYWYIRITITEFIHGNPTLCFFNFIILNSIENFL